MQTLAPILLFVYVRPEHTERTLESLMANELAAQSELYIYADGPKKNAAPELLEKLKATRAVIRKKQWCKTVHMKELDENIGVDEITVLGVSSLVNAFGKLIILEDDIVTSKGFLSYMNAALALYEADEKVMSVAGYSFPFKNRQANPYFIFGGTSAWGWGTWKRAWEKFNPDYNTLYSKISSEPELLRKFNFDNAFDYSGMLKQCSPQNKPWDIRWYASVFLEGGLGLWPQESLVQNIGHDNTGVHSENTSNFYNTFLAEKIEIKPIALIENKQARQEFTRFFKSINKVSLFSKIKNKISHLFSNLLTNKNTHA